MSSDIININASSREAFCWGMIGDNRTGKSITARIIGEMWRDANPLGTIVSHDPQGRFKDISDYYIPTKQKDWASVCAEMTDTLLILDEVRMLHKSNIPDDGLYDLMANRGENNIDIIYIVHNPGVVLNFLAYYTHRYFMFFTNTRQGGFDKKIPNYTVANAASKLINKYVGKYGMGEYPDFPHIIADTKSTELIAVNIDEDKLL